MNTELRNLQVEVLTYWLDGKTDEKTTSKFAKHVSDTLIRLAGLSQAQASGKLPACGSLYDVLCNRLMMNADEATELVGHLRGSFVYYQVASRVTSYLPRI